MSGFLGFTIVFMTLALGRSAKLSVGDETCKCNARTPCQYDATCSNGGGLGCKALGKPNCRYCGHGPYHPCTNSTVTRTSSSSSSSGGSNVTPPGTATTPTSPPTTSPTRTTPAGSSPTVSTSTASGTPGVAPSTEYKGYFFSIGDWGWNKAAAAEWMQFKSDSNQQAVAKLMKDYVKQHGLPHFVINVGDSFYDRGISHDGKVYGSNENAWKTMWQDVYGPELTGPNVPWFGVYGNHDYEGQDECCLHGSNDYSQCAQVQQTSNTDNGWVMPATQYTSDELTGNEFLTNAKSKLDDLNLELVAMEANGLYDTWNRNYDHENSPTNIKGKKCINERQAYSSELLKKKIKDVKAKENKPGLVVFSHSATLPGEILNAGLTSDKVQYFGGHTHNTFCNTGPESFKGYGCRVGGGGGCSSNGDQGVSVTWVTADGKMISEAKLI